MPSLILNISAVLSLLFLLQHAGISYGVLGSSEEVDYLPEHPSDDSRLWGSGFFSGSSSHASESEEQAELEADVDERMEHYYLAPRPSGDPRIWGWDLSDIEEPEAPAYDDHAEGEDEEPSGDSRIWEWGL